MSDKIFLEDFVNLLTGQKVAHMGGHLYADHGGTRNGQTMSGAKLWQILADEEPTYPISRADTVLFQKELPRIASILPPDLTLFDLGPGSEHSVTSKSIKLISATHVTRYRPVDSAMPFVDTAAQIARSRFPNLDIQPYLSNIFSGIDGIREPSFAYFGGGTLSNLIHPLSNTFPALLLEEALNKIITYAPYGWLLTSFDSTNDADKLFSRYGSKINNDFICNIMFRAAVDLPLQNFDPSKFVATPQWQPSSHQFAHILTATKAQNIRLADKHIHISQGQKFHITNSYKFSLSVFEKAVARIGYSIDHRAIDSSGMALYLLKSPYAPVVEKKALAA